MQYLQKSFVFFKKTCIIETFFLLLIILVFSKLIGCNQLPKDLSRQKENIIIAN